MNFKFTKIFSYNSIDNINAISRTLKTSRLTFTTKKSSKSRGIEEKKEPKKPFHFACFYTISSKTAGIQYWKNWLVVILIFGCFYFYFHNFNYLLAYSKIFYFLQLSYSKNLAISRNFSYQTQLEHKYLLKISWNRVLNLSLVIWRVFWSMKLEFT